MNEESKAMKNYRQMNEVIAQIDVQPLISALDHLTKSLEELSRRMSGYMDSLGVIEIPDDVDQEQAQKLADAFAVPLELVRPRILNYPDVSPPYRQLDDENPWAQLPEDHPSRDRQCRACGTIYREPVDAVNCAVRDHRNFRAKGEEG